MKHSSVFNITHDIDPAEDIRRKTGDLSGFHVGTARVLLALYERPEKMGNIFLPDKTRDEDFFQCKACLVLKLGPNAFVNDSSNDFGGFAASVGDWVYVRMNDGRRLDIQGPKGAGGQECLLIKDIHVGMVIPEPWMVW